MIIGTPGRLKECIIKHYTVLNQCCNVILDEGDVMIDLGFEEDVNYLLDSIPAKNMKSDIEEKTILQEKEMMEGLKMYRITQMFSATMPGALEKIAKKYLRFPLVVLVGKPGSGKKEIEQRVEFTSEQGKKYFNFN